MVSDGPQCWRQARSVASSQQETTEAGLPRGLLPEADWPDPGAALPSAPLRCPRPRRGAGDSPAGRCSRDAARPPSPDRRSRPPTADGIEIDGQRLASWTGAEGPGLSLHLYIVQSLLVQRRPPRKNDQTLCREHFARRDARRYADGRVVLMHILTVVDMYYRTYGAEPCQ